MTAEIRVGEMRLGALNLLNGCMEVKEGEELLVVREQPGSAYYDEAVGDCILETAREIGLRTHELRTARVEGPEKVPAVVGAAMEAVDHTLFLARIGDQMRFKALPGRCTKTVCYALDREILASAVCRTPYALTHEVLALLQAEIDTVRRWKLTCALGTEIEGTCRPPIGSSQSFTVRIFPEGPFRSIPCDDAKGRIVTRWLPASATHCYQPFGLALDAPVTLWVDGGRIVEITGAPTTVQAVREHYRSVSSEFGIDAWAVHSWHAGTNPRILCPWLLREDIERWNGVMHSHTRYAHLHTCGAYAPGEIALAVLDPSIEFDGIPFWSQGRLLFLEREEAIAIRDRYPGEARAFELENRIGV